MSDLAKSLREKLKGTRPSAGFAGHQSARIRRRHHQVAVRRGRRQRRRDGVHPRGRPRHAVHVVAGRLRRGCRFCSTGHQGFSRNLTTGEIIAQLWFAEHFLRQHLGQTRARHLQRGDDGHGRAVAELFGLGAGAARHAGRPRLRAVAPPRHGVHLGRGAHDGPPGEDCPVALAVSLHAPNDALRDDWCRSTASTRLPMLAARLQPLPGAHAPRDFITFEYCMLDGVNDQPEHARELVELVRRAGRQWRRPCKFNLIPFNPFPASGCAFAPPGVRLSPSCCRMLASSPPCARPAATTSMRPAASSLGDVRTAPAWANASPASATGCLIRQARAH
jgi:23S rRNA (adenine2503-C2)-methyltransferase